MKIDTILFEIKALLGTTEIPSSTYSELQIGDIIVLDQVVGNPIDVKIEGNPDLKGVLGLHETHKAIRIL